MRNRATRAGPVWLLCRRLGCSARCCWAMPAHHDSRHDTRFCSVLCVCVRVGLLRRVSRDENEHDSATHTHTFCFTPPCKQPCQASLCRARETGPCKFYTQHDGISKSTDVSWRPSKPQHRQPCDEQARRVCVAKRNFWHLAFQFSAQEDMLVAEKRRTTRKY